MSKKQPQFKASQLYGWETEPVDERPSEFMPSTNYATLSGYHSSFEPSRHSHRVRRESRVSLAAVAVFLVAVIAAGGWAIAKFAPMLHR